MEPAPATPAVPPDRIRRVDAGKLWSGVLLTAVVAVLAALLVYLVAKNILDIPMTVGTPGGTARTLTIGMVVLVPVVATLLAGALLHLLAISSAPGPRMFFVAIGLLVLALSVVLASTVPDADWDTKGALVVLDLVVGLVILILLDGTARRSILVDRAVAQPVQVVQQQVYPQQPGYVVQEEQQYPPQV